MSQSFWVSGAWERLRWLVLAMRVSWGGAGRTLVVWRHDKAGRSAPKFTHVDCLWRVLGAHHVRLSRGPLHMAAHHMANDLREKRESGSPAALHITEFQQWHPVTVAVSHGLIPIQYGGTCGKSWMWEWDIPGEYHHLPSEYWPAQFPGWAMAIAGPAVSQHPGKERAVQFRGGEWAWR